LYSVLTKYVTAPAVSSFHSSNMIVEAKGGYLLVSIGNTPRQLRKAIKVLSWAE
jgi:hypothetical protein